MEAVSPQIAFYAKNCGRKGRGGNRPLEPVPFSKTQRCEHKFSSINDPLRSYCLLFHHSGLSNGPRWSFNLCKMQERKPLQETGFCYFRPSGQCGVGIKRPFQDQSGPCGWRKAEHLDLKLAEGSVGKPGRKSRIY